MLTVSTNGAVRTALGALLAVACTSCQVADRVLGIPTVVSGTFPLASIDGKSLPDTLYELPNRTGGRSGCFAIAARGWLKLDAARHFFVLARHLESNCGTGFGSDTTATGDYRPLGDSLRLRVFTGTDSVSFAGSTTDTQIEVDDTLMHVKYVFQR